MLYEIVKIIHNYTVYLWSRWVIITEGIAKAWVIIIEGITKIYQGESLWKYIFKFVNICQILSNVETSSSAHKKTRKHVVCKVSFYFLKSSYSKSDPPISSAYAE